jgi:choline-sulfatase
MRRRVELTNRKSEIGNLKSPSCLAVVCLLLLTCCSARSRLSVLLITIDTLRADHVGCYGYEDARTPALDRLASEGVLFEQVGAQVPVTLPSHTTILTGLTPAGHGVHDNGAFALSDTHTTLGEILQSEGYVTGAVIGSYVLSRQFGLNQGFAVYEDSLPGSEDAADASQFARRSASEVADRGIAWLERHGRERFFLWLHFFDPHTPYAPPSPFSEQFPGRPYDGEIAYVDREVGRVLEYTETGEARSRTLVVVSSDHGEGLGEHREEDHSNFVYESTMRVPLIMWCPGTIPAGRRIGSLVRSVDIAPTILELLGLPVPEWMEGSSLKAAWEAGEAVDSLSVGESLLPLYHFGLSPLVSVRTGRWKFIASPRPELYDLARDPRETLNVVEDHPEIAEPLSEEALRYSTRVVAGGASAATVSGEQKEKLAALGYITSSATRVPAVAEWERLGDPKEHVELLDLVKKAVRLIGSGHHAEALQLLDGAGADNLWHPLVWHAKAWAYFRAGELDRAAVLLREGMSRDSSYVKFPMLLGRIEMLRGNPGAALEAFDRALALAPFDGTTFVVRGQALYALGHPHEALRSFHDALRLRPDLWAARLFMAYAHLAVGRPDSALQYATAALPMAEDRESVAALVARCRELLERGLTGAAAPRSPGS